MATKERDRTEEESQMTQTHMDVESTIPESEKIIGPIAEENIASAIRLLQAGAKPESVLRTVYLLAYFDGMVRA